MPFSVKECPHLISYTVSRFTCGRLTSGAFEMILFSKKISKKFTFGFADRQLHVTLVSQAFHVHVFHPLLQINRTVDFNQSKL